MSKGKVIMSTLIRCPYCGLLQDEPAGTKTCSRCGGGLEFEQGLPNGQKPAYIQAQLELDQVAAPAGQNVERYVLLTISAPKRSACLRVTSISSGPWIPCSKPG